MTSQCLGYLPLVWKVILTSTAIYLGIVSKPPDYFPSRVRSFPPEVGDLDYSGQCSKKDFIFDGYETGENAPLLTLLLLLLILLQAHFSQFKYNHSFHFFWSITTALLLWDGEFQSKINESFINGKVVIESSNQQVDNECLQQLNQVDVFFAH